MRVRRSHTSTELLRVGVTAAIGSEVIDPTDFPVELALMVEGTRPTDADYEAGTWEVVSGIYYACILVGPAGAITLAPTDEVYVPWVRVDPVGSERPEIKGGSDFVIEVY